MPVVYIIIILLIGSFCSAQAGQSVTLVWDPNPETDIAGYRLYYGLDSGVYGQSFEVGNLTTATVANLTGGSRYYFAVTAYNWDQVESEPSDEVVFDATIDPVPNPVPDRPPALIAGLQVLPDGSIQFLVNPVSGNPAPGGVDVEVSSDLQKWSLLVHLDYPVTAVSITDPEAVGEPTRFYRLRPR